MKRYTTRFYKAIAGFYLLFPVSYLIFAAVLFDIPANLCVRLLISPFYYLVSIFAVITGYGLWEARRWAWYLFVITNFQIAYGNALLASDYSASHHKFLAFLSSIVIIALVGIRMGREIRVPYFFPKIRWWESNPRYKLSVPVAIKAGGELKFDGEILDISMGGCFVKLRTEIAVDQLIDLDFSVFHELIHCTGTVVWKTQSTVTHPKGVGVKFAALDRANKKNLRLVCSKLKKIAGFYRKKRYLVNQDEFIKQLDQLEGRLSKNT